MDNEALEAATLIAHRYFGYAARSRQEIVRRLEKAEFAPEIIARVVADMTARGWLDDEAFAQAWVTDRADRKRYGKARLAQELQRKGVARETVQETLSAVDEDAELQRGLNAARTKWKPERFAALDRTEQQAEKNRLAQFLQRRGFGWDIIKKVLAELVANQEELS